MGAVKTAGRGRELEDSAGEKVIDSILLMAMCEAHLQT
jgi:hypothetical protein